MLKIEAPTTLECMTCASCGTAFAVPAQVMKKGRENHGEVYCPNGHINVWRKSEVEKLTEQLAAEQQKASSYRTRLEAEEQQRFAAEAARDKLKRRIKRGVCPCCKRSFENVKRHICTKHPEFAEETKTA